MKNQQIACKEQNKFENFAVERRSEEFLESEEFINGTESSVARLQCIV